MIEVYVVFRHVVFGGSEYMGAFSNLDAAIQKAESHAQYYGDELREHPNYQGAAAWARFSREVVYEVLKEEVQDA